LACISNIALGFHQAVGKSIFDRATATDVVTVSIDMELIPINDVPHANSAGLASHIANQLLGIQESDVSITMLDVQDLKSLQRYTISADIVAPAGSSAAVIARMEEYMSERQTNTTEIDGFGANTYSRPFLASIGALAHFPFPFVLKYDGSSVEWDASNVCDSCTAIVCQEGTAESKLDLTCCSVCKNEVEIAAQQAAAGFTLDNEGGRMWAFPMVKANLQLIPINDVANVEVSKLEHMIASYIGISAKGVTIVTDTRTSVQAHTPISFAAFIEGPVGSLEAIVTTVVDATNQEVGNATARTDYASLPFLADLGAPDGFEAPYIIIRNSVEALPPAYCAVQTCPKLAKCGDGYTLYRAEGECCSSCITHSEADHFTKLSEYELRHSIWAEVKNEYSVDLSKWRQDSAEWLAKYSGCKP
jgi:hypothetical protein